MKRLFLATRTVSVLETMFVSDVEPDSENLKDQARSFLEEERGCRKDQKPVITVQEIKSMEQVPDEWKGGALLWGTRENDDLTASDFLGRENTEEYKEYLRLKAKFE